MPGRAAAASQSLLRSVPCVCAVVLVALIAPGGDGARAGSGFVLKADALGGAGGSAAAGIHAVETSLGQTFTGAAAGGPHLEYAGLWRPGLHPLVGVDPASPAALPARFELHSVAPNPSRGPLRLRLGIPATGSSAPVQLRIFDVAGRMVQQLRVEVTSPGWHLLSWDGRDAAGAEVGLGVYFCRMDAGGSSASRRFVVIH